MATLVFTNCYCYINSVDLADHVKSVTLSYAAEMLDDTVMGDATRSSAAGLKEWSLEVEFVQDFASAKVDATLFPLVGAAAFAVEVRPVNTDRSATNPGFNGNVVLETYPPFGNSVGELATTRASFRAAGALSRSTA